MTDHGDNDDRNAERQHIPGIPKEELPDPGDADQEDDDNGS